MTKKPVMNEPIKIPIDEFVLELIPPMEANRSFIWGIKTNLHFPTGDILASWFRYDSGKAWIIDPLVQKRRSYVQPDEETFLRLANYDYIKVVSEKVTELLGSGDLRLSYDGLEGTLKDYQIHCHRLAIQRLDEE